MVVNARELPDARRRRLVVHVTFGLAVLASSWWGWSSLSSLWELERELQAARDEVPVLEAAADEVAKSCGLPRFSDPESLKRFPMDVGRFPSRRKMDCARRVTKARSDLIENYLEMDRLNPLIEDARDAISPSLPMAIVMVAGFGAWIYFGEIRHRRPRAG